MNYKKLISKLIEPLDNDDYRLKVILKFVRRIIGWG